uniref:Secreted protein n=1 Tax=Arundo donax TaxID=35708 RepID=A0A0A9DLT6_ARUDO
MFTMACPVVLFTSANALRPWSSVSFPTASSSLNQCWDLSLESARTRITLSPRTAMFKVGSCLQNILIGCSRCMLAC